ncbi:MAG: hypothetical protein JWM19_992 [Actinomycetia bacterium]|nr:hypothetical protein [Actinomycetes bacterium]
MSEAAGEYPDEAYPAAGTAPDPGPLHVAVLNFEDPDTRSWTEDLVGLLSLGAVRGWFDWCGHRISVRTLTTDEELLVAQLIREFEGGMGGTKAYATATAGLCAESIDHQPMPVPLGEHPNSQYKWALERFNYARRWYPPTIDAILDAYLQLEDRQRAVMAGLGKASAPGASSTPGLSASSGSPSAGAS